jgi:hypothetical protein
MMIRQLCFGWWETKVSGTKYANCSEKRFLTPSIFRKAGLIPLAVCEWMLDSMPCSGQDVDGTV